MCAKKLKFRIWLYVVVKTVNIEEVLLMIQ